MGFLWKTARERDPSSTLAAQRRRCYRRLPSCNPGRALRTPISSSAAAALTTSPRRQQTHPEQEAQRSSHPLQWRNYRRARFPTNVARVLSSPWGRHMDARHAGSVQRVLHHSSVARGRSGLVALWPNPSIPGKARRQPPSSSP